MINESTRQKLELFIKEHYIDLDNITYGKPKYSIRGIPQAYPRTEPEKTSTENTTPKQNTDIAAPKPVQKPVKIPEKASTPTKQRPGNTTILAKLKSIISLKFDNAKKPKTFASQLLSLIELQGLTEIEVYKAANIDRKLFSKIRHDDYHPSRKTAIALVLALRLSPDMAKDLLSFAGYALSSTSKTDVIIEFCLENQLYDLMTVNELLQEYTGQTP